MASTRVRCWSDDAASTNQAQIRRIELRIASEVTNAALRIESIRDRIAAATASRELAEEQIQAEESKFEVGLSTNFFVLQSQRDLATAQDAELRAILDYQRALIEFERTQRASLGGAGIALVGSATAGGVAGSAGAAPSGAVPDAAALNRAGRLTESDEWPVVGIYIVRRGALPELVALQPLGDDGLAVARWSARSREPWPGPRCPRRRTHRRPLFKSGLLRRSAARRASEATDAKLHSRRTEIRRGNRNHSGAGAAHAGRAGQDVFRVR